MSRSLLSDPRSYFQWRAPLSPHGGSPPPFTHQTAEVFPSPKLKSPSERERQCDRKRKAPKQILPRNFGSGFSPLWFTGDSFFLFPSFSFWTSCCPQFLSSFLLLEPKISEPYPAWLLLQVISPTFYGPHKTSSNFSGLLLKLHQRLF